jgi:hypothetical protein
MGFNAMRPGRVKPADLAIFLIALVVVLGLVVWALSA